jgi:hypothetical protein
MICAARLMFSRAVCIATPGLFEYGELSAARQGGEGFDLPPCFESGVWPI